MRTGRLWFTFSFGILLYGGCICYNLGTHRIASTYTKEWSTHQIVQRFKCNLSSSVYTKACHARGVSVLFFVHICIFAYLLAVKRTETEREAKFSMIPRNRLRKMLWHQYTRCLRCQHELQSCSGRWYLWHTHTRQTLVHVKYACKTGTSAYCVWRQRRQEGL